MKRISFITLFFLCFSCGDHVSGYEAPSDLIPKDKMINVMTEMVVLESHIQQTYVRVDRFYEVMTRTGDSLLAAKGIGRVRFERSFDYYSSHQDQMQEIYSAVLENLNRELGELEESSD